MVGKLLGRRPRIRGRLTRVLTPIVEACGVNGEASYGGFMRAEGRISHLKCHYGMDRSRLNGNEGQQSASH